MFCILEKDSKTFDYFKRYAACFEVGSACLEVDNAIQAHELRTHLRTHGFSENDTQAKLSWIAEYGRSFREYLNSIKLMYVICKVAHKNPVDLSREEFTKLEDEINHQRHCLSTMYT
jgi:hypothetical protein